MKKMISVCMVIMMLFAAAHAQGLEIARPEDAVSFGIDEQISIDLDGDGQDESLVLRLEGVEFEENLGLYVFGIDGDVYPYKMPASVFIGAYAKDVNGDGKAEIFICGDMYSDDYYTWCLNYTADAGLSPIPFDEMERGYVSDGTMDMGYGMITAAEGASITLTGSQDVLGTWMMSRSFTLQDGVFRMDEGLWETRDMGWDYAGIVAAVDLPAMFEDGEGAVRAGEEIMITASDLSSIAEFETADGRKGSLEIACNDEYGWGFFVNGVAEEECFEWIPYAD